MNSFQIIKIIINSLSIKKIKRISFTNDINGLRAIAVLGVVLYHLDTNYFEGGYLGLDILFIISGYLISNKIFSELNQDNLSLKKFYRRRFRRNLRAVLSAIIFILPFAFFLLLPKPTLELFCNSYKKNECIGSFDGLIIYYDTNHLTKTSAKLVGDEVIYILNEEE